MRTKSDSPASAALASLSYNASDFPHLHSEFVARGEDHGSIIVGTQNDPCRNVRALLNLLDRVSSEQIANQLVYLNNWPNSSA
jgi:hypothetical protein